jgi:hypothetical protein
MNSSPIPVSRPVRSFARLGAATIIVATLSACSSAPLSYLNDRQVYYKAVLNRYPVRVVAIDGAYQSFKPVPIAPGPHLLTLDAVPVAGFSLPIQKQYPFEVAPCTRYYIAAQRASPLTQDWSLVVEETWPVAGCDPAKELEKARVAHGLGKPVPASSAIDAGPVPLALAAPR